MAQRLLVEVQWQGWHTINVQNPLEKSHYPDIEKLIVRKRKHFRAIELF